ncbi:MAG: iron-siderophore ABC transporter substrate-binding protein [Rhodococcus sp. (in: high G+C Gram-positive bacteria)]|uniref:iron-siderophore ABC transporter substrate-binding protein n=1 Tax=Rhodococcus sp. TaxID=1831 RepID=UPI003BB571A7
MRFPGRHRRAAGVAAAVIAAALTGACSSSTDTDTAETTTAGAADASAFPVTIASTLGSATMTEVPQRVVTLGWGSESAALALGVVPVGMQDMTSDTGSDDGVLPWARARLEELDPDAEPVLFPASSKEIPFEQIAALEPDVILAVHSGLSQEQFDTLSAIAPTVAYPERRWATSWEDQITTVGQALGRTAQAGELVTETRELLADTAAEHPEFAGRTVAFGSATETGSYNFYFDTDPRLKMLSALGFTIDPLAVGLRESSDQTKFAAPVSMELLPGYDPDVLLAWYLTPQLQEEVQESSLFAGLRAVRDGSYVALTEPPVVFASSSPDVLSMPWLLDTLVPMLSDAANSAAGD